MKKAAIILTGILALGFIAGCNDRAATAKNLPKFIKRLDSPDPEVRLSAARVLNNYGPRGAEAIPALARLAVEDPDARVRAAAISTLGYIGPRRDMIPVLVRALRDENSSVRGRAARVLSKLGDLPEDTVQTLMNGLGDESRLVRIASAEAIGNAGPAAKIAIPSLVNLLDDPDVGVQYGVAEALGQIGPDAAPATLRLAAVLAQDRAPATMAEALGDIGPGAEEALPTLQSAMTHENAKVRAAAARAIWQISGNTADTVPVLTACLSATTLSYTSPTVFDRTERTQIVPDGRARHIAEETLAEIEAAATNGQSE